MRFGIMFFSSLPSGEHGDGYRLMTEAARYADRHGFSSVWTPERHFHPFGGLFANPSLTNAALAMVTERIGLRAGSLVSPLHDSVRIAEEWAMVDNLSRGRVGISFGSGWNIDDFVFFPDRYRERQEAMYRQIEEVRSLWRGEGLRRANGGGDEIDVRIFPRPVQAELPVIVTSSGNVETFRSAGRIGAGVLTHLIGQDPEQLGTKIGAYREARREAGLDPADGSVTLMLHTFLGEDREAVRQRVRQPFREYLRSAVSLEKMAAEAGGAISGGHRIAAEEISPEHLETLLDLTFERYFDRGSLMGRPGDCRDLVWRLEELGVDEIACLVDFLDDTDAVLGGLPYLDTLRDRFSEETARRRTENLVNQFTAEL